MRNMGIIGLLEIHGELIGEKMVILELREKKMHSAGMIILLQMALHV